MWIYPARVRILTLGGLQLIAPYPRPLHRRRALITILRFRSRGSGYRSFRFSHVHVLIVGSTAELLVGCSGGQFARHWSSR